MEEGKILTVDEEKVFENVRKVAERLTCK
jgi:hypothetical protein